MTSAVPIKSLLSETSHRSNRVLRILLSSSSAVYSEIIPVVSSRTTALRSDKPDSLGRSPMPVTGTSPNFSRTGFSGFATGRSDADGTPESTLSGRWTDLPDRGSMTSRRSGNDKPRSTLSGRGVRDQDRDSVAGPVDNDGGLKSRLAARASDNDGGLKSSPPECPYGSGSSQLWGLTLSMPTGQPPLAPTTIKIPSCAFSNLSYGRCSSVQLL